MEDVDILIRVALLAEVGLVQLVLMAQLLVEQVELVELVLHQL
jgi:hypothetical protein